MIIGTVDEISVTFCTVTRRLSGWTSLSCNSLIVLSCSRPPTNGGPPEWRAVTPTNGQCTDLIIYTKQWSQIR